MGDHKAMDNQVGIQATLTDAMSSTGAAVSSVAQGTVNLAKGGAMLIEHGMGLDFVQQHDDDSDNDEESTEQPSWFNQSSRILDWDKVHCDA